MKIFSVVLVCRELFRKNHIVNPALILKQVLHRIELKCPDWEKGCKSKIGYNSYTSHIQNCDYGYDTCQYCNEKYRRIETKDHLSGCVNYLRTEIKSLQSQLESKCRSGNYLKKELDEWACWKESWYSRMKYTMIALILMFCIQISVYFESNFPGTTFGVTLGVTIGSLFILYDLFC